MPLVITLPCSFSQAGSVKALRRQDPHAHQDVMGINSPRGRVAQMSEKGLKSCVGQVALTVSSQRQRTGAEAGRMMACLGYAEPLEGQGGLKSA